MDRILIVYRPGLQTLHTR